MSKRSRRLQAILVVTSFLCLASLLPQTIRAQDQSSNFDLEGKITQQSKGKLTFDTGQGILFHVTFDDKTSIVRADSSPGSEQDLKVGVKIHAIGDLQDSGEIKAQKIEIEAAGKSAATEDLRLAPQRNPPALALRQRLLVDVSGGDHIPECDS
jgi:hypothetical protein